MFRRFFIAQQRTLSGWNYKGSSLVTGQNSLKYSILAFRTSSDNFFPRIIRNTTISSTNAITRRSFSDVSDIKEGAPIVNFSFISKNGEEIKVQCPAGSNLLRTAQKNHVDLEGACECSVACSTCHVIFEADIFDSLPEATEDEDDMLDMAFGLTETSRLGCQIIVEESMEGMKVELPQATRNFYVDGHVPQPH